MGYQCDIAPEVTFDEESNPVRAKSLFDDNFYRCPNTGELVYKYLDQRMILVRKSNPASRER